KCKSSSRLWNADRMCLNTFNESNVTKNTQRQNENCYVNTEESSVFEKTLKESEIRGLLNELSLKPVKKKMKDYKFWNTQPVTDFDEEIIEEGPIDDSKDFEKIRKTPYLLLKEFEWVTLDLSNEQEVGVSVPTSHKKLYSTIERQIQKFKLPEETSTPGLRPIAIQDLKQVSELLTCFLKKFELSQIFSDDEVKHWLIPDENQSDDKCTVFSYVVEDPTTGRITDFFSFYSLPSSIIIDTKYKTLNAAYLFYYALESGIKKNMNQIERKIYVDRLNFIIKDCLIIAKKMNFDVFNALTLMDNPFFLENQKFGPGDGKLNYYLFNYRVRQINSGVTPTGKLNVENGSSVGIVML
ncbi:hypothetical protein PCK1_001038, partial [Pneumocystis canis]